MEQSKQADNAESCHSTLWFQKSCNSRRNAEEFSDIHLTYGVAKIKWKSYAKVFRCSRACGQYHVRYLPIALSLPSETYLHLVCRHGKTHFREAIALSLNVGNSIFLCWEIAPCATFTQPSHFHLQLHTSDGYLLVQHS